MIPRTLLESVLGAALANGGDFAEVFAQDKRTVSIGLEDRKIERLNAGRDRGAGVRVVVGEVTGYAYASDLEEASLLRAAAVASAVARGSSRDRTVALRRGRRPAVAHEGQSPDALSERRRSDLGRS